MRKLLLLVASLMVLISSSSLATTYYVKNGGNDSLNGQSDANAWATFNNINNGYFYPGDVICLKCGSTWNQELFLQGNGSNANNQCYISYYGSGNKPTIKRTWNNAEVCLSDYGHSWWTIWGIHFDNAYRGIQLHNTDPNNAVWGITVQYCDFTNMNYYNNNSSQWKVNGVGLNIPYEGGQFTQVNINNCNFTNCAESVSMVNTNPNWSPFVWNVSSAYCTCTGGVWCGLNIWSGVGNSTFDHWQIHDMGANIWAGPAGVIMGACSNVTLSNFWVYNVHNYGASDGVGVDFDGGNYNCTLSYSTIQNCDGSGFEMCEKFNPDSGSQVNNTYIGTNCINPQGGGNGANYECMSWRTSNSCTFNSCTITKRSSELDWFAPSGNPFYFTHYLNNCTLN